MSTDETCPTDGSTLAKDPESNAYCCFRCRTFYTKVDELLPPHGSQPIPYRSQP